MKKYVLILFALFALFTLPVFSQRYAFVDTDYILNKIPSYKAAQDELNQLSVKWQKEIEGLYAEIDKMRQDFEVEKILLTDDMKNRREKQIAEKEKETKSLQRKYFGPEGGLFEKRQELIKPIQDEIYNAIKDIAEEDNFSAIFDTASGQGILYYSPKMDKSDDVLEKLGYKN